MGPWGSLRGILGVGAIAHMLGSFFLNSLCLVPASKVSSSLAGVLTMAVPLFACVGCQSEQHRRKHVLRVQVLNNQILTPNLCYNGYYPNPKYLILGYWTLRAKSYT